MISTCCVIACTFEFTGFMGTDILLLARRNDELKHYLASGQTDIAFVLDFNKPSDELYLLLEKTVRLGFYIATNAPLEYIGVCLEELKKQNFVLTEANCQYRKRIKVFLKKWN